MDQEIEQRPALIHEVEPIERSRSEMIKTRGEIKDLVESPLVEACEKLWDLNILTLASSANLKDIGSSAYLVLDFDSLSDQNKETQQDL
ncbi:hypothetical protein M1307_03815, partial [Patescibacteria group bacterium]|nr:hypothetical protein [Patescibacteria group bacterium]